MQEKAQRQFLILNVLGMFGMECGCIRLQILFENCLMLSKIDIGLSH